MRELSLPEYENHRSSGNNLIGRVVSYNQSQNIIYYAIEDDQRDLSATEILDTLSLIHPIKGAYDVIRHWTTPEIKQIKY